MGDMINAHLLRSTVLHYDQYTEYELCSTQVNSLDKKVQALKEKCELLQKKLDVVKEERLRYNKKNMCKNVRIMAIQKLLC